MKVKKNTKFFLVTSIIVFSLLGFSLATNLDLGKEKIQSKTIVFTENDISLLSEGVEELFQQTIIETGVIIVESDHNEFENYLDEEKPLGVTASEFFILETSTVLFDSDQNKIPSSSFLDVPFDIPFTTTNPNNPIQTNEQNIQNVIFFDKDNFSNWLDIDNNVGTQTNFRKTL